MQHCQHLAGCYIAARPPVAAAAAARRQVQQRGQVINQHSVGQHVQQMERGGIAQQRGACTTRGDRAGPGGQRQEGAPQSGRWVQGAAAFNDSPREMSWEMRCIMLTRWLRG